jgi:zinc protease
MLIKAGSSSDPLGQSGLMLATSSLLEKSTKTKSAPEVADAFGFYGSDFSVDVDPDFTTLSTSALSRDREAILKLYSEVILQPTFPSPEVTRLKEQIMASIKRSYDEPEDFTERAFKQYLLGPHPYSRPVEGSVRDVQTIRQKDILQNYLKWFRPNNAILAVVGDYNDEFVNALREQFSGWESKPVESLRFSQPAKPLGLQLNLVERDDLAQAQIRFGHQGIKRTNPDFLTLRVANTILGGGFSSRLMKEIRIKRGLTYGIYSGFSAQLDEGPFSVSTFTRFDKVGETVSETLRVIKEFRAKGVTDEEVSDAIGYLKGAFPRSVETPEQLAMNLLALRFYGIPDTYLTDYIANLKKINKDDVNSVIAKYFHPDQMKVLIYSTKAAVIDQLRPIGTLEVHPFKDFL